VRTEREDGRGWKWMKGNEQETNEKEEKDREDVWLSGCPNTISIFDTEKWSSRCVEKERWLV
jgi:hypothetical protein